jgi:plastocyanin
MIERTPLGPRRRRAVFLLVLIVTASGLVTLLSKAAAASSPIVIKMIDAPPMFEPSTVTIKAGDTVEWDNVGNQVHHATSDPSLAIKDRDVDNPAGAAPFDSGFLKPGESFRQTFLIPGTYRYTCVVHEQQGMIGKIIVRK